MNNDCNYYCGDRKRRVHRTYVFRDHDLRLFFETNAHGRMKRCALARKRGAIDTENARLTPTFDASVRLTDQIIVASRLITCSRENNFQPTDSKT